MTAIRIQNLVKSWGDMKAVNDVSFTVEAGTLTVLLGPSGCGKSTILRMIAGLEAVDSGEISIGENSVTHQDPAKRGVSMVFQSYALFPHLSVRENILFGLKVRRVDPDERSIRLNEAANMVGLDQLLDRKPAQLSGGQRQRVALARAVVSKQPVCLMDEPLSNLDAKLRAEMRDEIHRLQRNLGLTMVYVTHDQTEAMSMADQVVLLCNGKIEQIGSPEALYETPNTEFAAQFLGMPPMNLVPVDTLVSDGAARAIDHSNVHSIGIRPEKIRLVNEGLSSENPTGMRRAVTVAAVDYMGAETVLRLDYCGTILMARVDGRAEALVGDQLHITWSEQDEHQFDHNGTRLQNDQAV